MTQRCAEMSHFSPSADPVSPIAVKRSKYGGSWTALLLRFKRVGPEAQVVIWFYEKDGKHLRCEVRHLVEGDRFDLVIIEPDGRERVETFEDSSQLNKRSAQLEREWRAMGWDGPYSRDF
jgi:hypothetical protein